MKDKLLARREKAKKSFDTLAKQREGVVENLNNIDAELNRLQGEYRLVDDLIGKEEGADPATIDATKAEETA